MALDTHRLVDTHQLQSDAWSLRDHPDADVRTLALGANEAAHDVAAMSAEMERRDAEIRLLRAKLAIAAELSLLNVSKRIAREYVDVVLDEDELYCAAVRAPFAAVQP